jgi:hypothetical protein
MASRELLLGEYLEVGDNIRIDPSLGNSYTKTVTRVTQNFAFVSWRDKYEGKFPRVFSYSFEIYPRTKWRTTQYKVFRSVDGK